MVYGGVKCYVLSFQFIPLILIGLKDVVISESHCQAYKKIVWLTKASTSHLDEKLEHHAV